MASTDNINARNNTKVFILINGSRVGRVQSFSESIANNVQVLAELGNQYMVELKKGITSYSFSIAKFYCRSDVSDTIKNGQVFSLMIQDTAPGDQAQAAAQVLELFQNCMVQSIDRSFTAGQATVAENAQVVTIGKGIDNPET